MTSTASTDFRTTSRFAPIMIPVTVPAPASAFLLFQTYIEIRLRLNAGDNGNLSGPGYLALTHIGLIAWLGGKLVTVVSAATASAARDRAAGGRSAGPRS